MTHAELWPRSVEEIPPSSPDEMLEALVELTALNVRVRQMERHDPAMFHATGPSIHAHYLRDILPHLTPYAHCQVVQNQMFIHEMYHHAQMGWSRRIPEDVKEFLASFSERG